MKIAPEVLRRSRVLVVEDHEPCARFLEISLTRAGYSVAVVGTVEAAWVALASQEFGGLVCDLLLPDGNGCEIIQIVRQRKAPIFAVAVSGFPIETHGQMALDFGFDSFLQKPLSFPKLVSLLDEGF